MTTALPGARPVEADTLDERMRGIAERLPGARVVEEPRPPLVGLARSFAQGFSFGFADEVEAAIAAISPGDGDEDFIERYYQNRARIRSSNQEFGTEFPAAAVTSEIAGALASGGVVAKVAGQAVANAPSFLGRVWRGQALGAAEGAAYGAGTAENIGDIPLDAALGAGVGAAVGGAVPVIAAGAATGGRMIRGVFSPERGAEQRIGQAIRRDAMTPQDVAKNLEDARDLGRPAVPADVGGESLRRELEVAAQSPGPAAELVERTLSERNRQQLARLSDDLLVGTGAPSGPIHDVIDATMKARARISKPLYERAMQFQAELNDDIVDAYRAATATPLGKAALAKARKILNIPDFDAAPLMLRIDALKRGLDDVIETSLRKGEKAIAMQARQLLRSKDGSGLLDLTDISNPIYREAREVWQDHSSYLDAIERGREILAPKMTAAALTRELAGMTNAETEAFRIGAVDAIVTRMRQQSADQPNLLKLLRSPEIKDKLKALMLPDRAARFESILTFEESMFRTSSQALRGSPTARRQAAMAEQEKQSRLFNALVMTADLVTAGLRPIVYRGIPATAKVAKERLLARQNEIIVRRLLDLQNTGGIGSMAPPARPRLPGGADVVPTPAGIAVAAPVVMPSKEKRPNE